MREAEAKKKLRMKEMTFAEYVKELEKRSKNDKLQELEKLQKKLATEKE